jgi:phenylpyruvate tautomerase PptA (4-oxalocrotonate tautomerase family)
MPALMLSERANLCWPSIDDAATARRASSMRRRASGAAGRHHDHKLVSAIAGARPTRARPASTPAARRAQVAGRVADAIVDVLEVVGSSTAIAFVSPLQAARWFAFDVLG